MVSSHSHTSQLSPSLYYLLQSVPCHSTLCVCWKFILFNFVQSQRVWTKWKEREGEKHKQKEKHPLWMTLPASNRSVFFCLSFCSDCVFTCEREGQSNWMLESKPRCLFIFRENYGQKLVVHSKSWAIREKVDCNSSKWSKVAVAVKLFDCLTDVHWDRLWAISLFL